jgi:hypothetical protein
MMEDGAACANAHVARNTPILSMTACASAYAIAAGTELTNSQATVVIWYVLHYVV